MEQTNKQRNKNMAIIAIIAIVVHWHAAEVRLKKITGGYLIVTEATPSPGIWWRNTNTKRRVIQHANARAIDKGLDGQCWETRPVVCLLQVLVMTGVRDMVLLFFGEQKWSPSEFALPTLLLTSRTPRIVKKKRWVKSIVILKRQKKVRDYHQQQSAASDFRTVGGRSDG